MLICNVGDGQKIHLGVSLRTQSNLISLFGEIENGNGFFIADPYVQILFIINLFFIIL